MHVFEFISGVLVAQIYALTKNPSPTLSAWLFYGGLCALAAIVALQNYAGLQEQHGFFGYVNFTGQGFLCVPPLCAIILACAFGNCSGARLLSRPTIVLLGEASYSIYLTHALVGRIVPDPAGAPYPLVRALFVFTFVCALGVGLFTLVELPAKRSLRRAYHAILARPKASAVVVTLGRNLDVAADPRDFSPGRATSGR
jgi:peptidoglycan/LPS O-acetylase OafA/YrhL